MLKLWGVCYCLIIIYAGIVIAQEERRIQGLDREPGRPPRILTKYEMGQRLCADFPDLEQCK